MQAPNGGSLGGVAPARFDQPTLFESVDGRATDLARTVTAIRARFGKNALLKGASLKAGSTMMERNNQIGGHRA